MDEIKQLKESKSFAKRWENRGYEKGDKDTFWNELLSKVFGIEYVSQFAKFEEHTKGGGFIDGMIPETRVIIEQKALNVDIDKPEPRQGALVTPLKQAIKYAQSFSGEDPCRPHWIVICNFKTFRVYDRDTYADVELKDHALEFSLEQFGEHPSLLSFLVDKKNSRSELEKEVSFDAGKLIAKLRDELEKRYIDPKNPETQHALNVLCVRLVFCLFCEDAPELFKKDAFLEHFKGCPAQNFRHELKRLFKVLDTPKEERDPYDEDLNIFPFVGAGLFSEDIEIPNFDDDLIGFFLNEVSQNIDWSKISPTIFGGIFEGTLNPETRRSGGMHYTSPENIHKVIDPLFLNDFYARFDEIALDKTMSERQKKNKLTKLHKEMYSLKIVDPASGSGNFLTETFLCLRRLEDRILYIINDKQIEINLGAEVFSDRVSLNQFYGIEINDFAVRVARVALWIAKLQSDIETQMTQDADMGADNFPLKDAAHIVQGNALRIDWNDVLPANECSYIIGNPPFVGYSNHSKEQGEDRALLFGKVKIVDYVACWYKKAANYMQANRNIHAAFVSTNSICQGQQVQPIWQPLFEDGIHINFAYRTFVWNNESSEQAHVHVIVVGFSYEHTKECTLFEEDKKQLVDNINGYLANAGNVFINNIKKPICKTPEMIRGCQPTDNGNFLFTQEDLQRFLKEEPQAKKWIRPYSGSQEFINGKERYCLWLENATPADLKSMPKVLERVKAVRDFRLKSSKLATRKKADVAWVFDEIREPTVNPFIVVPETSSENRTYIPIGFVDNNLIPSNALRFINSISLYVFGILMSQAHNAWMRVVCGRLESRYRYSIGIVYNNFPWPGVTRENIEVPVEQCVRQEIKEQIEACAQEVLDARKEYTDQAQAAGQKCSLADMYDPDNDFLYPKLTAAHNSLDKVVEAAYGVDFNGDEEKIVAHLFTLYEELTN